MICPLPMHSAQHDSGMAFAARAASQSSFIRASKLISASAFPRTRSSSHRHCSICTSRSSSLQSFKYLSHLVWLSVSLTVRRAENWIQICIFHDFKLFLFTLVALESNRWFAASPIMFSLAWYQSRRECIFRGFWNWVNNNKKML